MINVLFVCLGNICRSPTAAGVFQHHVDTQGFSQEISVDSAGTHAYHVGEHPDARAVETAKKRGVDISSYRARRLDVEDFASFQFIMAMDKSNLRHIQQLAPATHNSEVSLYLDYSQQIGVKEVPDPYYGGQSGFDRVFDLVDDAALGLLDYIIQNHMRK